jgi:8-oxo-dGTP pyrophosphatase MutT (NUDIX family)
MTQKVVISYGVACVRKHCGRYEVLMIKKGNSYAFLEFVRGSYDPVRRHDISYLLDGMTIEEKRIILYGDFDRVWYRAYGESMVNPLHLTTSESIKASPSSKYLRAERKYKSLLSLKDGKYLRDLIASSSNMELLWEIPKGRMNKGETNLMSAIREFGEETNIDKTSYRILFEDNTVEYTFIDNGVRYKYIYYLAIALPKLTIKYDYENKHMHREVNDLRFLSLEYIKALNNTRLHKISKIIIKKCKKYIV